MQAWKYFAPVYAYILLGLWWWVSLGVFTPQQSMAQSCSSYEWDYQNIYTMDSHADIKNNKKKCWYNTSPILVSSGSDEDN